MSFLIKLHLNWYGWLFPFMALEFLWLQILTQSRRTIRLTLSLASIIIIVVRAFVTIVDFEFVIDGFIRWFVIIHSHVFIQEVIVIDFVELGVIIILHEFVFIKFKFVSDPQIRWLVIIFPMTNQATFIRVDHRVFTHSIKQLLYYYFSPSLILVNLYLNQRLRYLQKCHFFHYFQFINLCEVTGIL